MLSGLGTCGVRECHNSEFKCEIFPFQPCGDDLNSLPYMTLEARMTGLEPATSGVTGRCSNQLSYIPNSKQRFEKVPSDYPFPTWRVKRQGLIGGITRG